jgi:hypothetical protein
MTRDPLAPGFDEESPRFLHDSASFSTLRMRTEILLQ